MPRENEQRIVMHTVGQLRPPTRDLWFVERYKYCDCPHCEESYHWTVDSLGYNSFEEAAERMRSR